MTMASLPSSAAPMTTEITDMRNDDESAQDDDDTDDDDDVKVVVASSLCLVLVR